MTNVTKEYLNDPDKALKFLMAESHGQVDPGKFFALYAHAVKVLQRDEERLKND